MPTFTYKARDGAGRPIQGELNAASSADAARQLRGEGKFVVSVTQMKFGPRADRVIPREPPVGGASGIDPHGPAAQQPSAALAALTAPRFRPDDVRAFAQQLAVMIDTGVALTDALESCVAPHNSPAFAIALGDVIGQVRSGSTFSAALARHPRIFSPLIINMVRASEASGQMGPMLRRVADFLALQHALGKKIKGAIAYPAVMLALSVGVVAFLMAFVLPRFAAIYAGKEDVLPRITLLMMEISRFLTAAWPYLAGAGVVLGVGGFMYLRTPGGKLMLDRARLAVPLIGPLLHKTYLARSLRTFGSLIQSGVSMLEAVELTGAAVGSSVYARLWSEVHERLQHGQQLSEVVRDHPLVPPAVRKMLEAGERSGKLSDVMDRVAAHCEEEVSADVKTVTSLIEPAIVVFLGGVVGTVVMAMLLPIFSLSKAMQTGGH